MRILLATLFISLLSCTSKPPTMLERGKEAVTEFFRPTFAPEPTVPAGMEEMRQRIGAQQGAGRGSSDGRKGRRR